LVRRLTVLVSISALLLGSMFFGIALADPETHWVTNAGIVGLNVTNLGYLGNAFSNPNLPSGEYPLNSNVEHIYRAGLWVGAITADDSVRVSTGAQDANGLEAGDEIREFEDYLYSMFPQYTTRRISNNQNADNYHSDALSTEHFEVYFHDDTIIESGNHTPLFLHVVLRALVWSNPYADDFVILDYAIVNNGDTELRDIYVGFWNDTTVGNTEHRNPYDGQAANPWDFWGGANGAWGPAEFVGEEHTPDGDADIWMMYEHDADGDEGTATSWVGTRLLGTRPEPLLPPGESPVSYNAWRFRGVPEKDTWYESPDEPGVPQPGKYQIMSNRDFDVGQTEDDDYSVTSNWVGLLSAGPFPSLAVGDTIHATFAVACGPDSLGLLANSKVAQVAYNDGFQIPGGPPSPRLEFAYADNSVVLHWAPGDSLDPDTGEVLPPDSPLREAEHHISEITGQPDFQGYRILRYQGRVISEDPYELATLVADYDKIDGVGFDTGLPLLNEEGHREFVDSELLEGFPYWYSVVSYSAPDLEEGLPEYQSGFNENAELVYPGPAPAGADNPRGIGVFPNPYRASSMFDARTGERELGRKIWFTGLPARCTIQIFNLVGELVQTLHHDDPTQGLKSWNMLTSFDRAVATGLYIYAVKDLDTGEIQRGKLVIIK